MIRPDPIASILDAQKLAFAPIAFQAAKVMRDRGVLRALQSGGRRGRAVDEVVAETGLSRYAADTLLEAGLSFGLCEQKGDRYAITMAGYHVESDAMTRANMDFVHDVCYRGFFHFDEAIAEGRAAGLQVFGDWPTIYEGLKELPEHVRTSWFAFDHFYSDRAFDPALDVVLETRPQTILDVGGNTGRFAVRCCERDPDIAVTIADLPGQLADMRRHVEAAGHAARVHGEPVDLLDDAAPLPAGRDAVWMSQFLVCFSREQIRSILRRARAAMRDDGRLWILDTYWDRQDNDVGRYALHGMSLYFTAMANGDSRVYSSTHMHECIRDAGLRVEHEVDGLGLGHTLTCCRR